MKRKGISVINSLAIHVLSASQWLRSTQHQLMAFVCLPCGSSHVSWLVVDVKAGEAETDRDKQSVRQTDGWMHDLLQFLSVLVRVLQSKGTDNEYIDIKRGFIRVPFQTWIKVQQWLPPDRSGSCLITRLVSHPFQSGAESQGIPRELPVFRLC